MITFPPVSKLDFPACIEKSDPGPTPLVPVFKATDPPFFPEPVEKMMLPPGLDVCCVVSPVINSTLPVF